MNGKMIVKGMVVCALLVGCAPAPATVEVSPSSDVIKSKSEALTLTAKVYDKDGQEIPDAKIAWTSSNPRVADITPEGAATIKGSGTVEAIAAVGEIKGSVVISVNLYTTLKIAEETVSMAVGEKKALQASILDENGKVIEGRISWQSSDENIATVDAKGEVTAIAAGKVELTAKAEALSAVVAVEATSPSPEQLTAAKADIKIKVGATAPAEIQALDAEGKPVAGFTIKYQSSDEAIATVGEDGTITAVAVGKATITGTAGDKTATVNVAVKK